MSLGDDDEEGKQDGVKRERAQVTMASLAVDR